ncbi:MAG: cytochrome c [Deltaproteobacteria bacterium]|nr:cytochrome c [Deltaproteobacteria bacterium]
MRSIAAALLLLSVAMTAGAAALFLGLYDVAATEPHSAAVRWLLSTAMEQAVERRADGIVVPNGLSDPRRIHSGFVGYDDMCVGCHGAPGIERGVVGAGLNPRPPELHTSEQSWEAAELYWIIDHGIKMTGMPAFGPTHDDEQLWDLVAFVTALPHLSAEDYADLRRQRTGSRTSDGKAGGGHEHR